MPDALAPPGAPRRARALRPAVAPARTPARVLLLAMTLFIIYGSLFPFDWTTHPLPLSSFLDEHDLFANRGDAIDNFILFVPFGIALQASFARWRMRALVALLAVLVLAIGIQLVQLYLPSRTASVSDAVWNTVGMGAGMLVAARAQALLEAQLAALAGRRDNFLLCLVIIWLCYESFPFVPTLDLGELRAHVKTVVFAPPFDIGRMLQHGVAAALAGIAAMHTGWLRRPARGLLGLGALALGLEVCVAYGELRRETLLGIVLGLGAGYLAGQAGVKRAAALALPLALAMYLFTVLTPYRGQGLDSNFTFTPFSHLLWHSTMGELPPAAFEALAIGAVLWSGLRLRRGSSLGWCVLVLLSLTLLEWVRVAVRGYHGDTTSLVMALVLAPCAAALRPASRTLADPVAPAAASEAAHSAPEAPPTRPASLPLLPLAAAAVVLTVAMRSLVRLPGVPYNLAKLFGDHPWGGAAVFSLALLWIGGGAWVAACTVLRLQARRRAGLPWLPLLLAGIALVSFALVDVATPEIMLNKIIGAPDLYRRIVEDNYWGEAWQLRMHAFPRSLAEVAERVLRYVALYSAVMIPLVVALLALHAHGRRPRIIMAALWLAPFWVLTKFVILDWAITDNLDELVAEGGSIWLAAVLLVYGANVALLAGGGLRRWPLLAGVTALLTVAGWFLFGAAMSSVVINNGRVFSGVQFLLGENRTALLSSWALFGRWSALYLGTVAVSTLGVLLSRRALPGPAVPARRRKARVPAV
jgi:VanZ family protein